ncbi:class I SAM-dependent methyltransferase [Rhizobium paknamense]|uniref:Ubiquinone/menaquinone biosynthesis C-methylase UbiE n=1 Tax=Rhizobium paknamense TaxID=1206817 RepID=A0ABU0IAY2_9HYPH|nr:class I SAM-dependent methyltransferase [Rhizobium paknamense]MDQ0455385.1 ubiquinone/menaquinone biosynthesis C-methylase UbiE [Rhizobium paknamense]
MPVDDAFARFEMARFYDAFNHHGEDGAFYENFAKQPCRILDVGCGTGSVTLRLAAKGHKVTGIDPAPGMLTVARQKDGAHKVEWHQTTAEDFQSERRFDLAIMTGHVFQVFQDDRETHAALKAIHRHLAPEGTIIIESRNPLQKAWQDWTPEKTRSSAEIADAGRVEVFYEVKRVEDEHVTFDAVFTVVESGKTFISESRLRFASAQTIRRLFNEAGFRTIDLLGWWDGSVFTTQSPEIIVIART